MGEYAEVVNQILNIEEYLENDKISLTDFPFDEIISIIRQIYDAKYKKGDLFAKLYSCFLSRDRDKIEVVSALKLFAEYMLILEQNDVLFQKKNFEIHTIYPRLEYYVNGQKIRDWYTRNEYKERFPFNGKGVIYSAITGDYDDVKEPEHVNDKFDYILFTNNPKLTSDVWKIVLVDNDEQLDNVRLARKIKIMGHEYLPEYDYSIWVDGALKIKGDIEQYIETYKRNEPMLCFNHFDRDCIYAEKEILISVKKDVPEIMEKQMERYRLEGYPERNGLIASGFMVRELHNERVKRVMEIWWSEVLNGSKRDQLSFNYACWKNDFIYDTSDLFICRNPYIEEYRHKG